MRLASSVDVEVKFPPPLMACAAGAESSCQWPCSGDQILPSGAGPDGCDIRPLGRTPVPPAKGRDSGVDIGAEEFFGAISERSEDAGQKEVRLTTTANTTPATPIAKYGPGKRRVGGDVVALPRQQALNFRPLPQRQGSFRPNFGVGIMEERCTKEVELQSTVARHRGYWTKKLREYIPGWMGYTARPRPGSSTESPSADPRSVVWGRGVKSPALPDSDLLTQVLEGFIERPRRLHGLAHHSEAPVGSRSVLDCGSPLPLFGGRMFV